MLGGEREFEGQDTRTGINRLYGRLKSCLRNIYVVGQHTVGLANVISQAIRAEWRNWRTFCMIIFMCSWIVIDASFCLYYGIWWGFGGVWALTLLTNTWLFWLLFKDEIRVLLINYKTQGSIDKLTMDNALKELAKDRERKGNYSPS